MIFAMTSSSRPQVRPLATALLACALAVLAGCADMGKIEPQAVAIKPLELNAGKPTNAARFTFG